MVPLGSVVSLDCWLAPGPAQAAGAASIKAEINMRFFSILTLGVQGGFMCDNWAHFRS